MANTLPQDLFNFIVANVHSVEELEVLVLLCSEQDKNWSVDDLDVVIRSNPVSLNRRLETLIGCGLAARAVDGKFLFQPKTSELRTIAAALIAAYRTRRIEVIELIFSKPKKEILGFSNAFKFKGGHGNG